jgi:sugar/nucleoside kinase (ribokinase family)
MGAGTSYKVGIIGALNIDLIIRGNAPLDKDQLLSWGGESEISCLTAGSVGYLSQNFKKLGCDVHLVSTLAADPFGDLIISSLKSGGIDPQWITRETGTQSAIGIYILLFGGSKRPITYRLPTHHGFPPILSDAQQEALLDSQLLHCGGYLHFKDLWNDELPQLFAIAQEHHILTSLDPQFPLEPLDPPWSRVLLPVLKHTDVLFLDENEAKGVTNTTTLDTALVELEKLRVPIIAVKLGEKGAIILHHGERIIQPVFPVPSLKFVDSIGAGDSFDTGFLYAILEGRSIPDAARIAAFVAAKSCEGIGGTTTFPQKHEIPD